MRLFAIPIIAIALSGCMSIPPPPETTGNIRLWVAYLCSFKPTADQIIEALDDAGRLDTTRDVAAIICATQVGP